MAILVGGLIYLYYSASQKGKENLDVIDEEISGLK
jgi:hypothetical protein